MIALELLRTEEIVWERIYKKNIQLTTTLKPDPIRISDIISRVVDVTYEQNEGILIISIALELDIFFLGNEGKIHFHRMEKRLRYSLSPEKIIENMVLYVLCHCKKQSLQLKANLLTVDLTLDIEVQGALEAICPPSKITKSKKEKITTFTVIGEKKGATTVKSTFKKQDCQHIIIMKPHLHRVDCKVLRGIVVIEGEIIIEVFYLSTQGVEKYGKIRASLEEVISFAGAVPEQIAKTSIGFVDICYKSAPDVMIVLEYKVKLLKKVESQIITEFHERGYKVEKEELLLRETVIQGEFAFLAQKSFTDMPYMKDIIDIHGSIKKVSYVVEGSRLIIKGHVGVEVIYKDEYLRSAYNYLQMDFSDSHMLTNTKKGMSFDVNAEIAYLANEVKGGTITISVLVNVAFSGYVKRQISVVTNIIPRVGVVRELVSVERILESKEIDFTEEYKIKLDDKLKGIKDIKAGIECLDVSILDHRFLIQGAINIHIYYIGSDGVICSQKSITPIGILGSVANGKSDMHVQVKPKIQDISSKIESGSLIKLFFSMKFFIQIIQQEDIYLVTGLHMPISGNYKNVFVNTISYNMKYVMPLISPAFYIKDVKVYPSKKWYEEQADGLWATGVLCFDVIFVGRDKYIHQDFDELDFKFYIDNEENMYKGKMDLKITPLKTFLTSSGQILETELQVTLKTFHWEITERR